MTKIISSEPNRVEDDDTDKDEDEFEGSEGDFNKNEAARSTQRSQMTSTLEVRPRE